MEIGVIQENFFKLLKCGALGEQDTLVPMSVYKWRRLLQIAESQHVMSFTLKGINRLPPHKSYEYLRQLVRELPEITPPQDASDNLSPKLTNILARKRLAAIKKQVAQEGHVQSITLQLLEIIVSNVVVTLNHGISLRGIIDLGTYLRKYSSAIDFSQFSIWLSALHLTRMAQLQGSILITLFDFSPEEIPFTTKIENKAVALVNRSLVHTEEDVAEEWHFRQTRTGFVRNNAQLLRRNLMRSIRYLPYAPIETVSNFIHNFVKSLSEIEE